MTLEVTIASVRFLFLGSLLVGLGVAAQPRDVNARCRRPCLALVEAPARARLCGLCGAHADPMGWLFELSTVPVAAFDDDDWSVRWAAIKADAKRSRLTAERRLAQWVEQSGDTARPLACLTSVYAAGASDQPVTAFFAAEPKAGPLCAAVAHEVTRLEHHDVLSPDRSVALEALALLSTGHAQGPARLVLDVVASHPREVDEPLAALLVANAERGGLPAGAALLRDAREADAPAVDRLLAVYSKERDRQRPLLSSTDKDARRQAVAALAPLAPLSAAELQLALADPQASIRMAAAVALARGERRSLTEAAEARLLGRTDASAAEKRRWLTLLADVDDPACVTLTRAVFRDETHPDVVRAEALVSLAGCGRKAALDELTLASRSDRPVLQAGVMRAVLLLPREPAVAALVERALRAVDDEVLMGAAKAIAAHRLTPLKARLVPLIDHQSPEVRVEALRALWALDVQSAQRLVLARLGADPSPVVRSAAATLLPELGGPLVASALARASKNDPDPHVKIAALDGLRRLGLTP